MVTEKLKLLNDQSYFLVSDVSVVCPRCGARLAANRSPVSLVPAGPGGFRCSPPRTRNAGAVGPHDPQVPVFRILLTRQLRTACAYRRTVAAGKVAGSFPRSGVRTTFACSSFLFPDCAAQSRTVRIAPHCVVPISRFGPCCTVRYRVVPRRSVRAAPYRSVRVAPECCRVVPCIPCKRSVPVPNHPVLPRSRRAGVQGMAYRGDGKSAPQPLSSPTGTAGRTVPMNRSLSLRPRPDRVRSETRGGSRSDAGDGSGECRKPQGAPWEAAPFLPSSRS